jgi:hypothetical protein
LHAAGVGSRYAQATSGRFSWWPPAFLLCGLVALCESRAFGVGSKEEETFAAVRGADVAGA